MPDDIRDIIDFYNQNAETEQNRLDNHRLEFDLTWRFLEKYLPEEGSILEIGAATGRYTLPLVERGYNITAVDLSSVQLQYARKIIADVGLKGAVKFLVADVRDLSVVAKNDFDVVLLMGPLYHLVEESDREKALQQVYKCLKEGGLIFTSFISRYGILGDLLKNIPDWIKRQKDVRSVLTKGRDSDEYPRGGFRGYFVEVSVIKTLHEGVGFETIELVGVEPAISADDESYNKLDEDLRKLWLDLLFEVSANESTIGASRHLLYIGRKAKSS
jgi:SAM-dependent methyltransferase